MSRFECQSCGHRFDEPAYHKEGCSDYGYSEVAGCPICGGGFIENDRQCWDCVWRAEDGCTVWDCEYISRSELYKATKKGLQLRELIKEVAYGRH